MLKKVDPVYILTYDDNTILHIPIGTLLDKLSIDIWSDIHRYKDSFPEEFAIGKVSEEYVGWVRMPFNDKLLARFMKQYFVNSEIKLLCDFDCNIDDILYYDDVTYLCYGYDRIRVKSSEHKSSAKLFNSKGDIVEGNNLYSATIHKKYIHMTYRIYYR